MVPESVNQWMLKSHHDLLLAQHELERKESEIVTEGVCFHSQQCAEKALKAYLIVKNAVFPRTHDLESLLKQCAQWDVAFAGLETGMLTEYAVEIRYADDFYIPEISEAKEACRIAQKIFEFVKSKIDTE